MTEMVKRDNAQGLEQVLIGGDLKELSSAQRLEYYRRVCDSLGLNPLTKPFEYISLNGKLVLYAKKDATEQLRKNRGVSIAIVSREVVAEDVYVVTARATDSAGRSDESIGAVSIAGLRGESRANALMKAETKAKRRVTLSIAGLGMLDETEVETVPGAQPVRIQVEAQPAPKAPSPAPSADTASWQTDSKLHIAPPAAKASGEPSLPKATSAVVDVTAAAPATPNGSLTASGAAPSPNPVASAEAPSPVSATGTREREPGEDDGDDEPVEDPTNLVPIYRKKKTAGKGPSATWEWFQVDTAPKASTSQLAKVHVMLHEMKVDETAYRQALQQYYGKDTAALLAKDEASDLIERLEQRRRLAASKLARQNRRFEASKEEMRELIMEGAPMHEPAGE